MIKITETQMQNLQYIATHDGDWALMAGRPNTRSQAVNALLNKGLVRISNPARCAVELTAAGRELVG